MATMSATASARPYRLPFVITASAAGTIIEWYDFYLYGVLAAFFSTQFFPKGNDTALRCGPSALRSSAGSAT